MTYVHVFFNTIHIRRATKFVKALNFEGRAFKTITEMLPHLSDAKLKGGMLLFTDSEKRRMLRAEDLKKAMLGKGKHA